MTAHTHTWVGNDWPDPRPGRLNATEAGRAGLPNGRGSPGRYSQVDDHQRCLKCRERRTITRYFDWLYFKMHWPHGLRGKGGQIERKNKVDDS